MGTVCWLVDDLVEVRVQVYDGSSVCSCSSVCGVSFSSHVCCYYQHSTNELVCGTVLYCCSINCHGVNDYLLHLRI